MVQMNCIEPVLKVTNILKRGGLYPNSTVTKAQLVQLIFHSCYYLLIVISLLMNVMKAVKARNEAELNRMICVVVPMVNLMAKIVTILLNEKYVLSIVEDLTSNTFNRHTEKLNDYIKSVYRISELMWKYYTLVIAAFLLITAVLPIMTNIETIMIPPPFDFGKYDVIYKIIHLITGIYLGVSSICYDSLFMMLMAICVAQLYILSDRLINIFQDAKLSWKNEINETVDNREMQIIKECIILHETINQ
ncbi:hypothetical protein Trydic_g4261 [Trypoxylus dichotomus]